MWNLERILMSVLAGQWWRWRHGEQTWEPNGGRRGWGELREWCGNTILITVALQ